MNIKRGMTGVWALISTLWGGYWANVLKTTVADEDRIRFLNYMVYGFLLWWGLLYIGFWISSLFKGNEKKNKINK
jgi:hypothetical protein